jgi:hypothetical protein
MNVYHRPTRLIISPVLLALLVSCGGGGGGSAPPPPPPSGLSYTPSILIVGQAMTPLTPTVTGQVSSYAVSPALPTGLSLNTSTGVISGTPTAAAPQTEYTVTASNSSGKTSADASLTIVSAGLAYPSSSYVFAPGVTALTITPIAPVNFTKWTVSPALPAGLTLDTTLGTISGQPSAIAAATNYTITATGPDGQETTTLRITVGGAPLLNLGLSGHVTLVRYVGTSVLSQDSTFTWLLQDFATGTTLATGTASGTRYVDLEDNVMIDQAAAGLEVRSATTGSVQATISPPTQVSWYRLAVDGSYIAAGSPTGLTVWSPAGAQLFSQTGDYSNAMPFAAAGQLQVANGPAGATVIQTFAVPAGTSTTSPAFQGTFAAWFVDGQRFITSLGGSIWTYSNAAVLQEFTSLAAAGVGALGGSGTWYWNSNASTGQVTIYQIGSGGTPALTLTGATLAASGTVLSVLSCCGVNAQLTVIDLSGATPVATNYTNLPFNSVWSFGAQSPSEWLVGTYYGIVLDGTSLGGTPRTLTLGAAYAVAAGTSFISVATAAGKIFVFNSSDDSPAGTVDFGAWQLSASPDGSILAAAANPNFGSRTNLTINIYSLPSGAVSSTFPYSSSLAYMTMSGAGNTLGELFNAPATPCLAQAISVPANTTILCDNTPSPQQITNIQLSPDGTLIADSNDTNGSTTPLTNVYKNGTLVTTLPGYAAGWLSNGELLVDNYAELDGNIGLSPTGTTIYDASGNQVSTPPLLGMDPFQLVPGSSTSLYDNYLNTIVSLTSGNTTWASGDPYSNAGLDARSGGVTGTQVVFISNNLILAQPY